MKITGIITEFNPFHNGHEYILSQARKQTGCDLVVVAMSGDFVQRGAPAIVDKTVRTKAALLGGADLVVELPVIASTASASDFALGGVAALAACGVDTLVFGCEQEDFDLFPVLAEFLENEPSDYKDVLSGFLKEGCSYPLARAKALERFFPGVDNLGELLVAPNNILALEYLRAIKRLGVPMKVCPIKRIAVGHHSKEGVGGFASATAIREGLLGMHQPTDLSASGPVEGPGWRTDPSCFIPNYAAQLLSDYLAMHQPLCEDDFSAALCYRLVQMKCESEITYPSWNPLSLAVFANNSSVNGQCSFLDGSTDLFDRIFNRLNEFTCLSEFCRLLHTKDCTLSRLKRLMFHILLDITEDQMVLFREKPCSYIRVLGFHKDTSAIAMLKQYAQTQQIPVILSVAEASRQLENNVFFHQDLFARELYIRTLAQKDYHNRKAACPPLLSDYRQPLIVV